MKGFELISHNSTIDHTPANALYAAKDFRIETWTFRAPGWMQNEWMRTRPRDVSYWLDCGFSEQEAWDKQEQHKADRQILVLEMLKALGISDDPDSIGIQKVLAEVFCVARIRRVYSVEE